MLARAATRAPERRPSPSRHSPQTTARGHQIEQQECGCVLVLKNRVTGNVRDKVIEQHAIKRVGRDGELQGMAEWPLLENTPNEHKGKARRDESVDAFEREVVKDLATERPGTR